MRRWLLPGVLALLLGFTLWLGRGLEVALPEDGEALLDAVMDKLGVTQQTAVLSWLEETGDQQTVWIARNGTSHFHGHPLCGGMKAPVAHELFEAVEAGYRPCGQCFGLAP